MATTCTIGDYLLIRLKELGVKHIFGVPGDYNLAFLDQIVATEGLEWIGNCNELNAAYAADGYARINGIGALVTTFGVGELSAVNGIAGSYAEQVPVVKITGSPSNAVAAQGAYVHHTLGDGDFTHFSNMYKEVTVAQTTLTQENAAEEIDRVLQACWLHKRPVYINLPADISQKEIKAPESPLLLSEFTSDPNKLREFVDLAVEVLNQATSPIIVADYEVNRYHLNDQLRAFVEKSGFPITSLSMGKGVINENHPQFIGVYNGKLSEEYVKKCVEEADCILLIGVKLTDSTTGGFSFIHDLTKIPMIELHPSFARINNECFEVAMKDVLEQFTVRIERRSQENMNIQSLYERELKTAKDFNPASSGPITQKRFWQRFSQFLKTGDVIIADQGTAFFGTSTVPLPEKATFVGQPLWGSIGYTLPSLLGTQIASPTRRNILVIGDGSFQLTAQELSTIMRQKLKPIIILINNDGYTVERAIYGAEQAYNDINMWKYHLLPEVFGGQGDSVSIYVTNEKELDDALRQAETSDKLVFIEVVMGRLDAPQLLKDLAKAFAQQNAY